MRDITKHYWFLIIAAFAIFSSFTLYPKPDKVANAIIEIKFNNKVKGSDVVLRDSMYSNAFGEKYTITKLRYYVTNILLNNNSKIFKEKDSYHLVDESKSESQVIKFFVPEGEYYSLQFLLGVDSLHNVSGAQTDDLDPTKDMFWTWNSGYVMAKMEGNSPDSKLVNNKFEFHVGGFAGTYNVLKEIHLNFPVKEMYFNANKTYKILIDADINTWWQQPHDIKIAEHANITSPGINAKNLSDNYAKMFHIEKIIAE